MCFKTMDYLLNVQMFSQFVCVCMFVCECFPFFQCLRLAQGYHLQSRDLVIEDRFIFPQIIQFFYAFSNTQYEGGRGEQELQILYEIFNFFLISNPILFVKSLIEFTCKIEILYQVVCTFLLRAIGVKHPQNTKIVQTFHLSCRKD